MPDLDLALPRGTRLISLAERPDRRSASARSHRLGAVIACVRPTLKPRYPLTPIARYALDAGRRHAVRPVDPPARPDRWPDRAPLAAVHDDHRQRASGSCTTCSTEK